MFTVEPVRNRALPTGNDNGLSYLVETKRLEDCLVRDCPALADLQHQFEAPTPDSEAIRERQRVTASVSPGRFTLVAVLLLALNKLGLDLMTAYVALYSIGPLWFAAAFAYLLSSLWGLRAAGIALVLLAFKLFPPAGFNYADPATIAVGVAVLVWARLAARSGDAPWTLVLGSLVLVSIHPIGALYGVVSAVLAVSLARADSRPMRIAPAAFACFIAVVSFAVSRTGTAPPLPAETSVLHALPTAVQSVGSVARDMLEVEAGLFGSLTIFCGAAALGFFTAPVEQRPRIVLTVAIFAVFFPAFTLLKAHRGDLIPVVWVPLVVMLFGGVGQAFLFGIERSFLLLVDRLEGRKPRELFSWPAVWPVLAFALVLGYSFQMAGSGLMHLLPIADYLRQRQPLMLSSSQPELLRQMAKPGDAVLYTSTVIMPYYFIRGAMQFGAVYHDPCLGSTGTDGAASLRRPDIRFAATYNPTVYHPAFEGLNEDRWWITRPPLRFSALNTSRAHGPISREGMIRAADFRWIDIEPRAGEFKGPLKVMVKNPGPTSRARMCAMNRAGGPIAYSDSVQLIPAQWTGPITFDMDTGSRAVRFRIVFPDVETGVLISGILFGDDPLHWPWAQKADVTVAWKDAGLDPVTLSFDPARLLPPPLNRRRITVLNDEGSSVLLKIDNDSGL
jgi:hypothetical protein